MKTAPSKKHRYHTAISFALTESLNERDSCINGVSVILVLYSTFFHLATQAETLATSFTDIAFY